MKNSLRLFLAVSLVLFGCSRDTGEGSEIDSLREELRRISDTTGSLAALVASDYSTCPGSGDTSDPLIRKICNVAQAATNEARVELKGQLALFTQMLQNQIDAINNQMANISANFASINSDIATINGTLTTLDGRLTTAESAITALQTLTASISGTLAGNMIVLEIGNENASAGPLYESVLRRNDKRRFNGYVEAVGPATTLPNAPIASTNTSATVVVSVANSNVTISNGSPAVVTWAAHGRSANDAIRFSTSGTLPTGLDLGSVTTYYVLPVNANTFNVSLTPGGSAVNTTGAGAGTHHAANNDFTVGNIVRFADIAEGGGFTSGDFAKEPLVTVSATPWNTFSVALGRNATQTTTFGGNVGVATRIIGRGMSSLWAALDASDLAVRVSNLGSKRYNFIIRRIVSDGSNNTAELCYDKTNNLATFVTINAAAEGGDGANIVCK